MLISEARWLADVMKTISSEEMSPLLNLGSSTLEFRTTVQPHIQKEIFDPLIIRGVEVTHFDLKEGIGIDITGDIFDGQVFSKLVGKGYRAILCSNILEHVDDPEDLLARCSEILQPGGYLFITVPYSYPYHPDPIDTGYRPTPQEITDLLPQHQPVSHEVISGPTFTRYIITEKTSDIMHLVRILLPFTGMKKWKASISRLPWLFKPFLTSGVVLKKAESDPGTTE